MAVATAPGSKKGQRGTALLHSSATWSRRACLSTKTHYHPIAPRQTTVARNRGGSPDPGGLQSKRIAAESAGATTDPFPQWFAAQPATSDGFEPGEKEGELLAAEDVAVECDLGGLPTLDDGEQAGDATCVFDQASCEGKFEASLHASAGF